MTKAQAVALWGKPDRCVPGTAGAADSCEYLAASTFNGRSFDQPFAYF